MEIDFKTTLIFLKGASRLVLVCYTVYRDKTVTDDCFVVFNIWDTRDFIGSITSRLSDK